MNQTEAAEAAQVHLQKLSPDDHISREIIRKYEDEKNRGYQLLSAHPARAIALAEALNVDLAWLVPDLGMDPASVKQLKKAMATVAALWPVGR